MKGIILAGGAGTRLRPLTKITSKQLLPVYNQPMVFYPLQTLMDAGIRDILIIIAPQNSGDFLNLLGSGEKFGCNFAYEVQEAPNGIAEAFLIGERFIEKDPVTLILGDNLFEDNFASDIKNHQTGAKVFVKKVPDPERFGVIEFDKDNRALSIEEKPKQPRSNYAVTGLYTYDNSVVAKAKSLKPSARGELEITDVNRLYLEENKLNVGFVNGKWLDCGTFESLYEATVLMREKNLKKC